MESFYSQLLIVLMAIVSILICILIFRKVFSAMNYGDGRIRQGKSKDARSTTKKKIHPRGVQLKSEDAAEVKDNE